MKIVPRGFWRPLRWLLILVCASGVALAANTSWITTLRVGHFNFADWFNQFTAPEAPSADIALPAEPSKIADTGFSKNQWLNSYLFARPATGWTLDPVKTVTSSMKAQTSAPSMTLALTSSSSSLPAAFFSSGFVSYSNAAFGPSPAAPTGLDGTWSSLASGNWSTAANWQSGFIADGAGASAHFDAVNITTDVTVTLDSSRTIGNLYVKDTDGTNHITIAPSTGSSLTFDSGNPFVFSVLEQSAGSAGDTIAVPIFLHNDLHINNPSAHDFSITGDIASSATSGFQAVSFAGNIHASGNIKDGTTGGAVFVDVVGGTVVFTGTNTYNGGTEVEGGTLLIHGINSSPIGNVYVDSGGTLGGHGTIAGNVFAFGGTITGDTATTVGTLTLTGNVSLHTGETTGGTYLANLSGNMSDLLAITGFLTLGSDTTLHIVGAADGTTTYTIATFMSAFSTQFGTVTGLPSGYDLVYNPMDIELVPTAIPEPATWIGAGGAGAAVIGYWLSVVRRRKLRAFFS